MRKSIFQRKSDKQYLISAVDNIWTADVKLASQFKQNQVDEVYQTLIDKLKMKFIDFEEIYVS